MRDWSLRDERRLGDVQTLAASSSGDDQGRSPASPSPLEQSRAASSLQPLLLCVSASWGGAVLWLPVNCHPPNKWPAWLTRNTAPLCSVPGLRLQCPSPPRPPSPPLQPALLRPGGREAGFYILFPFFFCMKAKAPGLTPASKRTGREAELCLELKGLEPGKGICPGAQLRTEPGVGLACGTDWGDTGGPLRAGGQVLGESGHRPPRKAAWRGTCVPKPRLLSCGGGLQSVWRWIRYPCSPRHTSMCPQVRLSSQSLDSNCILPHPGEGQTFQKPIWWLAQPLKFP